MHGLRFGLTARFVFAASGHEKASIALALHSGVALIAKLVCSIKAAHVSSLNLSSKREREHIVDRLV